MNLLVTGAAGFAEDQLTELERMGHRIFMLPDERGSMKEQGARFDCGEIEGIICNGLFLYHDIREFSDLEYIQLTSAGYDRVPLRYITEKNIKLNNAKGVYSIPMAEWAVLKLLEVYKRSEIWKERALAHEWKKERDIEELCGKHAAVFGFGNVGQEIAKRLKAFGVFVTGVDIKLWESSCADRVVNMGRRFEVLRESDIVILTLPLTVETEGIADAEFFGSMKKDAILMNLSRGRVVCERDLKEALRRGCFRSVILDVFAEEPLPPESEWWEMERVIVTPHNSFVSNGNQKRLFEVVKQNLIEFQRNTGENK